MDFLKYLDILIGLAVVMVLLSPAVTAITQIVMWLTNKRSAFLNEGLKNLITQLDGHRRAIIQVHDGAGNLVTNAKIDKLGSIDPNTKQLVPAGGLDPALSKGVLNLALKDASTDKPLPDHTITVNMVPQGTLEDQHIRSFPTGATGDTTLIFNHSGAASYVSRSAEFSVKDPAGNKVAANINLTISPKDGDPLTIDVQTSAARPAVFEYPEGRTPALSCTIACKVTTGNPATPLPGHTIDITFPRNPSFDTPITSDKTKADGTVSLSLLTPEAAYRISSAVLEHPMIGQVDVASVVKDIPILGRIVGRIMYQCKSAKGEVIEREELIRILLELAADEGASSGEKRLDRAARRELQHLLKLNGIPAPGRTLAAIRDEAQRLEKLEPEIPACVRQSKAIITAARSDFVGKINNWFDQSMDRVSNRYGFNARVVTVFGAFVVAFGTQIDLIELISRLSADDQLRASLVTEAKNQQEHLEKLASAGTTNQSSDLEAAKAVHAEIQQNLSKLRSPDLLIIPDHILFQSVPRARLLRNPAWKAPHPKQFELVVGTSTFTLSPQWKKDLLSDLQTAIQASAAPVITSIEKGETGLLLTAKDRDTVQLITEPQATDLLISFDDVAQTRLVKHDNPPSIFSYIQPAKDGLLLVSASGTSATALTTEAYNISPEPDGKQGLQQRLVASLRPLPQQGSSLDPVVEAEKVAGPVQAAPCATYRPDACEFLVTSMDPAVQEIRLLRRNDDPFSNVLSDTSRASRVGWVSWSEFDLQNNMSIVTSVARSRVEKRPNHDEVVRAINESGNVVARQYPLESLVITSKQTHGPIELRYVAGNPRTNILNTYIERQRDWGNLASGRRLLGVFFAAVLLSLGAPFWYDTLKNLLKLRPALATKEEEQRRDRATLQKPEQKK